MRTKTERFIKDRKSGAEAPHSKTLSCGLVALMVFGTILASCVSLQAQIQQAWVAKYNNGITNGNHQSLKMALDASGNIYVLGVSQNANTNTGYVVVKYAPNGNQVWAARYDSTNYPSATPSGFALDSKNNVVVTGNAVTVKYDANGGQLWTAPYNAQAIAVDAGENTYITGVSSNFTTIKLSAMGSNIWTATDSPTISGPANIAQAITVDTATNVYVCGSKIYMNSGPPNFALMATAEIVQYDLDGNLNWKTPVPLGGLGGITVKIEAFTLDNAGNAYVLADAFKYDSRYNTFKINNAGGGDWYAYNPTGSVGSIARSLALDKSACVFITGGDQDYYPNYCFGTYKLDTNGNNLWGKLYPSVVSGNSEATSIATDQRNNVYVTGYSPSQGTNLTSDIVTLKYDSNGNQVWVVRYDGPGHGNDAGNSVAVDNSGNVYVAGYETETNGSPWMVLIKYSPITLQKQSNGNVILHAYGAPGESFDLQASTNLQTWQDLGDVIADTNGVVQFDDTNAALFNHRFYYTIPQ